MTVVLPASTVWGKMTNWNSRLAERVAEQEMWYSKMKPPLLLMQLIICCNCLLSIKKKVKLCRNHPFLCHLATNNHCLGSILIYYRQIWNASPRYWFSIDSVWKMGRFDRDIAPSLPRVQHLNLFPQKQKNAFFLGYFPAQWRHINKIHKYALNFG